MTCDADRVDLPVVPALPQPHPARNVQAGLARHPGVSWRSHAHGEHLSAASHFPSFYIRSIGHVMGSASGGMVLSPDVCH